MFPYDNLLSKIKHLVKHPAFRAPPRNDAAEFPRIILTGKGDELHTAVRKGDVHTAAMLIAFY